MPRPHDPIFSRAALPQDKGFSCPKCHYRMNVTNTRQNHEGTIYRRRLCPNCEHRLSTVEVEVNKPSKSEQEQWRLIRRLLPKLISIADEIDLLRAEHE